MKKIILLPLLFIFIACGGTDDDTDDITDNLDNDKPFLEKFDGFGYQSDGEYYYFSDSTTFLKYVFLDDAEDGNYCVEFQEGLLIVDGYEYKISIVTNNSTSLLMEMTWTDDGENIIESYEFTVDSTGNTLSIKYDNDPNDIDLYTKTTTTFASLCN